MISTKGESPVIFRKSMNETKKTNEKNCLLNCLKPVLRAINRWIDDWEIPIDQIRNDFELIGVGIEGSVFRGNFRGENVACKRVKTKEETNIRHLKKLNHCNIIKFRGISLSSPSFYIIMEYCAYGSLYDLLKRRREMNFHPQSSEILDWSKQIASGVEYLHSKQIVHRDLKSPNILFAKKNLLKISDFGTSKELIDRRSQIMSLNGTSAWMAPEIIRHEPCSEKIDVWSFGIVLWEMNTCSIPYQNIDPSAVMFGVGKGTLSLSIPSSIPETFQCLMKMCWHSKPSNRPRFDEILRYLNRNTREILLFELTNEELLIKHYEELQSIYQLRSNYEKRLEQVTLLYNQLKHLILDLEEREEFLEKIQENVQKQTQISEYSVSTISAYVDENSH